MKIKIVRSNNLTIFIFQLLKQLFVLIITFSLSMFAFESYSQNTGIGINNTGAAADSSAIFDVSSTSQGLLVPRMNTTSRNAIVSPVESLFIYNTDTHCFEAYFNGAWSTFGCLGGCHIPRAPIAGTNTQSKTQIIWNWSKVNNSASYKWGTTNSYASATDIGKNTTYTQSNLVCSTSYNLYVWAYDTCGISVAATLTQSTSDCCSTNYSCTSGNILTIAGSGPSIPGQQRYSGDGGQALCAGLCYPMGVAFDASGNMYIADENDARIRKVVLSTGIITTIAGNGLWGYTGDGGPATAASMHYPWGIVTDGSSNLYIPEYGNNVIRKVNTSTGIISTYAGKGTAGFSGDGGQATNAEFNNPDAVAIDASGNLYITDLWNERIRKITMSTGIITTIAGNGTGGFSGDGGPATSAEINAPQGIATDGSGNVYICDLFNNRVRKINVSDGIITTIAGNGPSGGAGSFSGDGGPATAAGLYYPQGVAVDGSGNVYIVDQYNQRIRKVNSSGIISTFAGTGFGAPISGGFTGDGGPATNAELYAPWAITVDSAGNVFISDTFNNRIREVCK